MPTFFTQAQLQRLRPGDRVTYAGMQWQVIDYSSYEDDNGYETAEWQLRSEGRGRDFYLLREVDPANPDTRLNWYFSEEIRIDQVSGEHVGDNISYSLWQAMREQSGPYLYLRALGRLYTFESQTTGTYDGSEGKVSRTTWDYWDEPHLWNLAIEAWPDGELHVYSTKKIDPSEFSEVEKAALTYAVGSARDSYASSSSWSFEKQDRGSRQGDDRTWQWVCAWSLVAMGVLIMMFGGW